MGFNSLFVRGKKFNLFLMIFFFIIIYQLIGIYNVQSLNYYHVDYYSGGGSSGIVPTLESDNLILSDYSNNINGYATMTGTSYSATVSYYSPHPIQIAYSTIDFFSNQTCFPFGTHDSDDPEMKTAIDDNADSSIVYIHTDTNIYPSVSDITFIGNTDELDSSNRSYLYYQISSNTEVGGALSQSAIDSRANTTRNDFANSWGLCDTTWSSGYRHSMYAGWQPLTNRHIYDNRFFVFNSTGLGSIDYNFLIHSMDSGCINEGTNFYRSGYFKLEDNPTFTSFGTNSGYSGTLSGLEPETLYVIQLSNGYVASWGGLTVWCDVYGSKVNSTYDLHIVVPEWDCGDYGECINGTRFRICIDLTGENPDRIDYQFCYVAPEESIYFGFEDYTTTNIWYNYWGFFCSCSSETKEILYPEDWFVENANFKVLNKNNKTGKRFDFVKMTSETAYEGDKSLKMWNIPPQLRIPNFETFVSIEDTLITDWISPTNYTDNNSWVDSENSFNDGVNYSVGSSNGNVSYGNYDIESKISDGTQQFIRSLTVKLDTNIGASPDTIQYSCIQISLSDEWSSCKTITGLTVNEQSFLVDFDIFAINYDICVLDTLKVRLILDDGSGTIQLDWIPVMIETYNPSDITFVYQDVVCENLTVGVYPDIRRNIDTDENDSIFVERNITLPTPYMSTSFKVKKCIEPELKFYSTPICLDFYDHCYTHNEDCNYESKGTITYYLKDAETGEFLYDITSEVIYPNKWEIREYAIDSLQPNKVYTIGFAVIPENTVDPDYYCIYLDDVNIDIRNIPLVCESECDDSDEIKRYCKEYDELGFCVVCEQIIVINSPNCLISDSVIDKVKSCQDWCGCEEYDIEHSDYYTKYVGEIIEGCNTTLHGIDKCCEYSEIEDSQYCSEYCETQEIKTTPDMIQDELKRRGLGFLGNFFTAMFAIIMIVIGIAFAITHYLSKGKENVSWQIFIAVLIIQLLIVSVLWTEFSFIGIIIVVILALFLAKMFSGD